MKKTLLTVPMVAFAILLIAAMVDNMPMTQRTPAEQLRTDMQKLWTAHIAWTRNVVLNIMDDLPGTDVAVKRLLQNQDDIGNAVKPIYGDAAGNELANLLKTHINEAAELVKAVKKGDNDATATINKQWHDNADDIAAFLSKANVNLKLDEMKTMMHDHLKLLTDEVMARHNKDYEADAVAFDKSVDEILNMSDMIADGIIKQFPNKFSSTNKKVMSEK
jgi:hypothetical protein